MKSIFYTHILYSIMNIHPLWFICILVRISLILPLIYYRHSSVIVDILKYIFIFISLGFFFKSLQGSNNETQIAKVFWHETRIFHALFYFLAFYYLLHEHVHMSILFLVIDLLFSISYRFINNI